MVKKTEDNSSGFRPMENAHLEERERTQYLEKLLLNRSGFDNWQIKRSHRINERQTGKT